MVVASSTAQCKTAAVKALGPGSAARHGPSAPVFLMRCNELVFVETFYQLGMEITESSEAV